MNNISENMSIISILMLTTLFFIAAGCQQAPNLESPPAAGPGYQDISAAELQSMIEEEVNLLLVDVREPHEYNEGHIPGAILLPLGQLKENHEDALDREKTIVLICRSGRRSADAADFLSQEGYENVYNLQGGMLDWSGPVEGTTFRPG